MFKQCWFIWEKGLAPLATKKLSTQLWYKPVSMKSEHVKYAKGLLIYLILKVGDSNTIEYYSLLL